ncbi:helix-turn-helix domain-containing protein [Xanthocytophaga flava]|nr:helix-turn-helix transcriptional regulator [Xanthocytophaga flavus]MDJ1473710.1 helix-turn-helix transcriptional regulator [Xanthocytophaga flavus]
MVTLSNDWYSVHCQKISEYQSTYWLTIVPVTNLHDHSYGQQTSKRMYTKETSYTMNLKDIGERIRLFRMDILNLSQREFAQRMGVAQGNLSSLEKGHQLPSCFFLWCLHATYQANVHWLFTGVGEPVVKE